MNEVKKLIARIGTARDAISRKDEQTSIDFMIDGVLMNCAEMLKEQEEQEAVKPQDAEMLIIHNGGAEEYVKDIESIVLLAHKDYDIVYCGRFSEGR